MKYKFSRSSVDNIYLEKDFVTRNTGKDCTSIYLRDERLGRDLQLPMQRGSRLASANLVFENSFLGSHVSIKTQKAVLYNQNVTLDPFHPNISIHILHTVLYTFPQVLTRRIFSTIKSFISWLSFILCP